MPTYQDGTEMKVGDIFMSPRSGSVHQWKILALENNTVFHECLTWDETRGETPFNGINGFWVRVSPPKVKKSGFAKFIQRVESK